MARQKMLHTRLQASEASDSEEKRFFNIFLCISKWGPFWTPWATSPPTAGTFLTPGQQFQQVCSYGGPGVIFQAPEPSSSGEEYF